MTDLSRIRNFSIVAHIDHGKSTLADRLIQLTGTVAEREMKEQVLDSMDIERERGITIKANTVRIEYPAKDGDTYVLNLIDTPGHVDFAYEVSRSMQACRGLAAGGGRLPGGRGADAGQCLPGHRRRPRDRAGPQQDRPARRRARPRQGADRGRHRLDASDAIEISAKTGLGIPTCWRPSSPACPRPRADRDAPLKAMLVDSWYDAYLGVVVLVRVIDGVMKKGDRIRMMKTGAPTGRPPRRLPPKHGTSRSSGPARSASSPPRSSRCATPASATRSPMTKRPTAKRCRASSPPAGGLLRPLPRRHQRFRGPARRHREAGLNDASFSFEMETSAALGFGFRCGFLGLLHLEVIRDRLEREYDIDLITTAPSVVYHIYHDRRRR
jgi:GTP-binding protein LepA